jgi:signal transduction histidine kinase
MHLPILVGDKVEAILEFGCDKTVEDDRELFEAMVGASERLSRFFERRRAQINFQRQREELRTSAERLFAMAAQLVDSQEEERRRIAGEIHDDFTQRLALVSLKISNLAGKDRGTTTSELDDDLEDVRKSITTVAGDLRDLSHQLHPATLELLGLTRAIRARCDEFQRVRGIETSFQLDASDDDVSQQAALCLYRILQESLMNVAKHAPSAKVHVSLTRSEDQLEFRIRDDGPGFIMSELRHKGIGLMNMKERARLLNGKLMVSSHPGQGTEVTAQIPAVVRVHQKR